MNNREHDWHQRQALCRLSTASAEWWMEFMVEIGLKAYQIQIYRHSIVVPAIAKGLGS